MISLQIVDDHKMVVESLSKLINESGKAQVTGVYYDLESCGKGLESSVPEPFLIRLSVY